MATLIVTKDKGGVGRIEGMTFIEPSQEVPVEALQAIGKNAGLDGVVIADLISAMAMHERAAARHARAAAMQTARGEWRKLHEALAQMYTSRVSTLEALLTKLKLPRLYVSPAARMAHLIAEHTAHVGLLAGSVSERTLEIALVDVAFTLAERSLASTQALAAIVKAAKPSGTTAALDKTVKALNSDTTALTNLRAVRTLSLVEAARREEP
jgi:hypothetical protein